MTIKPSKDQKYYRKNKNDSEKEFRGVPKEGTGYDGVRGTRKSICFRISLEAGKRLEEMATNAGITQWEMATRMIYLGLPGIVSSGYATFADGIKRYEWNSVYLNPKEKKVRYKGVKGEKQIQMRITTTAWNKIHCHSTATAMSMSRIFQNLCLTHKPLAKEQLNKQREQREEYMRSINTQETSRRYKEYDKPSKFIDIGDDLLHIKLIPFEKWDEEELMEYEKRMDAKLKRWKEEWDERRGQKDESLNDT